MSGRNTDNWQKELHGRRVHDLRVASEYVRPNAHLAKSNPTGDDDDVQQASRPGAGPAATLRAVRQTREEPASG
jgi:hypothetical protein